MTRKCCLTPKLEGIKPLLGKSCVVRGSQPASRVVQHLLTVPRNSIKSWIISLLHNHKPCYINRGNMYCNDWNADQTCQKISCWALYWVSNTQLAIFNWASGGKIWNEPFRRTPKSGRRWWNTLIGWHAGWVQTFHWCINVLQINSEFCRAAGQLNKVFRRLHRFSEAWKAAGKQEGAFNLAAVTNTYNLRFFKPEI